MDLYNELATEQQNLASVNIDKMSSIEIVTLINQEDKGVPFAVEKVLPETAKAIDAISEKIKNGGRLIYVGAGTSGRLGVIDASECPPTYGVSPETVQGIIAGGRDAMFRAAENEEDDYDAAIKDLKNINFNSGDVCFGISASGTAAYVKGALEYASALGASTVLLCCNKKAEINKIAGIAITPEAGPEVINGSTRMKAGTAQKLILNMISTGVMVRLGRVRKNLLVYMKPSNKKLTYRAARIIQTETNVSQEEAAQALEKTNGDIGKAIEIIKMKADII